MWVIEKGKEVCMCSLIKDWPLTMSITLSYGMCSENGNPSAYIFTNILDTGQEAILWIQCSETDWPQVSKGV